MKKLLSVLVIFILCENISQAQTRSAIVSTIDTKIVNNPTAPIRAADLNAIFKSIINFQDTVSLDNRYLKIQTQNPVGTLAIDFGSSSGPSLTLELMSSGAALPYNLFWSASRYTANVTQKATDSILTINVAGANQTFTNPAPGGGVSGVKAVTITRNTNTSFNNVITTKDGKTATYTVNFYFQPKLYYGFVSTTSPVDADIIAMTGVLRADRLQIGTVSAPGSPKYPAIAFPVSFGAPSITINTFFQPTTNYTVTTRSLTNASGNSQSYYIIVFNNTTSGGYTFSIN